MESKLKTQLIDIQKIKENENNPRIIRHEKFLKLVQSVKDFPEMLQIRPIVVNKDMVIIGGNMRYNACLEAGIKEVPVLIVDLTSEQEKEFMIKDNVSGGEWDFSVLKIEWGQAPLDEWGVDNWNVTATSFEPNLNPNTDKKEITSDDIDKINNKLQNQYSEPNQDKRTVMCPHCLEEFQIDK
jgi:hypothetical protein